VSNGQINAARAAWIERQAHRLLAEFWRRKELACGRSLAIADKLPVDPKEIATGILKLAYSEPYEIGYIRKNERVGIEIAGVVDRLKREIIVAGGFSSTIRRFTGAHELAHYLLHPQLLNLRESPLTDGSITDLKKPLIEKEADLFAAELIIPKEIVFELFGRLFGDAIDWSRITDKEALYLSNGRLWASAFARMRPLQIAKLIAEQSSFVYRESRSLAEIFGVSSTAFGIQLLRHRLVGTTAAKA
jgi:Zn-dependent peptidase ImmA (M78 family)